MAEGLLKLRLYLAGGPSQVTTLAGQMEQAEQDDVIATPTLVLASSEPERRIIGDLDDGRLVFQKLGLL
ncbi:MAG: circadian clock KaiB family protein [Candidatus Sedimenticola endophacoides]